MPSDAERLQGHLPEGSTDVAAIVLAAGFSNRFGLDDKRRHRLGNGKTLLEYAADLVSQNFDKYWVVIRTDDEPKSLGLSSNTSIVRTDNASQGMGASLRDGFRAVTDKKPCSSAVAIAVFLGDMPCISGATIKQLMRAADENKILRPVYQGSPGHPVIFGRRFWPQLLELSENKGAQAIIHRNSQHYYELSVPDSGVCSDIDIPEHLTGLHIN